MTLRDIQVYILHDFAIMCAHPSHTCYIRVNTGHLPVIATGSTPFGWNRTVYYTSRHIVWIPIAPSRYVASIRFILFGVIHYVCGYGLYLVYYWHAVSRYVGLMSC